MSQPMSMDDMYDMVDWLEAGSLDDTVSDEEGEDDEH